MGKLRYGAEEYDFEDRALAHLMVIINQKARRREGFLISWSHRLVDGSAGRSSIWVTSGSNIGFEFSGSREATMDPTWLEAMMQASYTARGIDIDELQSRGVSRAS